MAGADPEDERIDELARLAAAGELVGYFGYGSLVNRATLRTRVIAAYPARLKGWRRTWLPHPDPGPNINSGAGAAPAGELAASLLTAVRDPAGAIDGLLVFDRAENLAAVDAREFCYHRRDIGMEDLVFHAQAPRISCNLHVYEAQTELPPVAGASPILRSYLDAVMQGFYTEFGEAGLRRFVAETAAFHTPIHEDRDAPLYPRAVRLSALETALFEAVLAARAAAQDN